MRKKLNVFIFADDQDARGYRLSQAWIERNLALIAIAVSANFLTVGFALHWYRKSQTMGPDRIATLEHELAQKTMELESINAQPQPALSNSEQAGIPEIALSQLGLPLFPKSETTNLQKTADHSVQVDRLSVKQNGNELTITSALRYIAPDGGRQTGRLFAWLSGPDMILTYPPRSWNTPGAQTWINPSLGESFSVGKFRAIAIKFSTSDLKRFTHVYLVVTNDQGQPLFIQSERLGAKAK